MTHNFSNYARLSPNHLALVAPDGRHWSRGELQRESERLAADLLRQQAHPVDPAGANLQNTAGAVMSKTAGAVAPKKAGTILPNTAESIALALAVSRVGSSILAPFGIEPEQDNVHYCGLSLADPTVRAWATDSLHYGHVVVLAGEWNPRKMLHDIARYRVTTSYMTPDQFRQLLDLPEDIRTNYDVSSMRQVICAVASYPERLKDAMAKWWEAFIYCEYPGSDYTDTRGIPSARQPGQHDQSRLH